MWDNDNKDRLYISGDKLKVWKNEGVFSQINRLFRTLIGQFNIKDVSKHIGQFNSVYYDDEIHDKLELLGYRFQRAGDHAAAEKVRKIAANSFKPLHNISSLKEIYYREIKGLKSKNSGSEFGLMLDFETVADGKKYLLNGEKGTLTHEEIIQEWDASVRRVYRFKAAFNHRLFVLEPFIKEYGANLSVDGMWNRFQGEFLPKIIRGETTIGDAISELEREVAKHCLGNMFNRALKSREHLFSPAERKALEAEYLQSLLNGDKKSPLLDRMRTLESQLKNFIDDEDLRQRFERNAADFQKEHGVGFDLSPLQNRRGEFIDLLGKSNSEEEIDRKWNIEAEKLVISKNRAFWENELFIVYADKYPQLNLKKTDIPQDYLKLVKKGQFKIAIEEWVKEIAQNQLVGEIRGQMVPFYESFWTAVGTPAFASVPGKLDASDANEMDHLHRVSLLEVAANGFSKEYGVTLVFDPMIMDKNCPEDMGREVNLAILKALSLKFSGVIQLMVDKRMGKESSIDEREKIFHEAVRLMAERSKLDPEKVLVGEVRLTGYSERDMLACIHGAVISEHGTLEEKAKLKLTSLKEIIAGS